MSTPTICTDIRSAISSPVSVSGPTRFAAPAGQMIDLFGQVPVLANLSARQAKELRLMTSGTYGQPSTISSKSGALQRSLESKLQARLSTLGSTLYTLTWKPWVTPSGVSRLRQRGRAHQISGSGITGWLTPRARGDAGGQRWKTGDMRNLEDQARMYGLLRGLTVTEVSAMSLSAAFCRRLMGIPPEWCACAVTAIQSMPSKRKSGSKP